MKIRNVIICFVVALVIAVTIYVFMNTNNSKKTKKKEENKTEIGETINIDYKTYQELRSEVHENETYAIVILKSDDETCNTFKEEVLYSFQGLKSKVYEIDLDKLSEVEMSGVITDISTVTKKKEPSIITPTMIIMKKGKVVVVQEGLTYSSDITNKIKENKID